MTSPRLTIATGAQPPVLFPTDLPRTYQISLPKNQLLETAQVIGKYVRVSDAVNIFNTLETLGLQPIAHEPALRQMSLENLWNQEIEPSQVENMTFQVLCLGLDGHFSERVASLPSMGVMIAVAVTSLIFGNYALMIGSSKLFMILDAIRTGLHTSRLMKIDGELPDIFNSARATKKTLEELLRIPHTFLEDQRNADWRRLSNELENQITDLENSLVWMKVHFSGQKFSVLNVWSNNEPNKNNQLWKERFVEGLRLLVELKSFCSQLPERLPPARGPF